MKFDRKTVFLIAGIGMIVGSFFAAARAAGGIMGLIFFVITTDFSISTDPSTGENLANTIKAGHISSAVYGVASFLILFFGGRWMLRGPSILERWIDSSETKTESGGQEENENSEQAAAG